MISFVQYSRRDGGGGKRWGGRKRGERGEGRQLGNTRDYL